MEKGDLKADLLNAMLSDDKEEKTDAATKAEKDDDV